MDLFFALSDPRRRMIVEMLANNGQLTAGEICKQFDITAQAVSQHLRILRESGLLLMQKHAQQHIYQINTDSILELDRWATETTRLWNGRFDALEKVLKEEKANDAKKVNLWQRKTKAKKN
jgi:DNA-binding transcriptional ArsR family regulator